MDDQLEVLKQGPLFLAHVLGLRWLRPGSLHGLRGLGRRFGPGFQGWPVRCRFWAEGAEKRLPGALSGSSTTCTTWTAPVAFPYPCPDSALGVVSSTVSLAAFVVLVACCN